MNNRKKINLTPEDEKFIRDNYKHMKNKELAEKFQIEPNSMYHVIKRLGIVRTSEETTDTVKREPRLETKVEREKTFKRPTIGKPVNKDQEKTSDNRTKNSNLTEKTKGNVPIKVDHRTTIYVKKENCNYINGKWELKENQTVDNVVTNDKPKTKNPKKKKTEVKTELKPNKPVRSVEQELKPETELIEVELPKIDHPKVDIIPELVEVKLPKIEPTDYEEKVNSNIKYTEHIAEPVKSNQKNEPEDFPHPPLLTKKGFFEKLKAFFRW